MMKEEQLSELRSILIDRRRTLVVYSRGQQDSWERIQQRAPSENDQASINVLLNQLSRLDEHRWREIRAINAALQKLEDGSYGVCEECDDFIDYGRIKVLPYARRCFPCAEKFERFYPSKV